MYGISLTPSERKARKHSDHIPEFVPGFHSYRVVQAWSDKKWWLYQDNEIVAKYDFRNDAERAMKALEDRQWYWRLEWFHEAHPAPVQAENA